MKFTIVAAAAVLSVAWVVGTAQDTPRERAHYVNFDPPGVVTSAPAGSYNPGTIITDMNASGDIISYYTSDSSIQNRGFLRHRRGKITLLDDPQAGTPVQGGAATGAATYPEAINEDGTVVGTSENANSTSEGFTYTAEGGFKNFFVTEPSPNYVNMTQALSINARGEIAGRCSCDNTSFNETAFIRDDRGHSITFEAPDASTSAWYSGTLAASLNDRGETTGYYYDANWVVHDFIRSADGVFTEYAVPGSGTSSGQGAWPTRIYNSGAVLGFYADSNWATHTYIRLPDGTVIEPSLPPGTPWQWIWVSDLGLHGEVAGTYADANGVSHAFFRKANGMFVYFTDPAAGTASGQGTQAARVNAESEVAGIYIDSNGLSHGFLWTPDE